jgi:hypothetical protein
VGAWSIFSRCFEMTRGCSTYLSGTCPFPIAVPGDLNDIFCMNLHPAQWRLFMGFPSSSRIWWPCHIVVWSLKALILEEINPVSKSKRHNPSVNTCRRTIRGPVRCITQGNRSQVSNNIFHTLKDSCQIWEASLAVRRLISFNLKSDNL